MKSIPTSIGLGLLVAYLVGVSSGDPARVVIGGLGIEDPVPVGFGKADVGVGPIPFVILGGGVVDPSSLFGGVGGVVPCLLIDSICWWCIDISPLNLGLCRAAGLWPLKSESLSSSSSYAEISMAHES